MPQLRSIARQMAPAPVRRLVRRVLDWKNAPHFHPHTIVKSIGGESFPFYIGDATANSWYAPQKDPVTLELAFIRDHMLSPGELVFDVGSHHGLHAVFMAQRPLRVIAIEPSPHNVAILRKNIALNGLQNVIVRQTAVGNARGSIRLPQDSNAGGVILSKTEAVPSIEVDLLPLDQLAEEHGFPHFLKIDVEGFEARVLEGARQILERRPRIAIEVHVDWVRRYGSSIDEVIGLLNLPSYQVWVLPYDLEIDEVRPWGGEDMNSYPPPKFTLFLLPSD
jgi:FkbM family methyltransferase